MLNDLFKTDCAENEFLFSEFFSVESKSGDCTVSASEVPIALMTREPVVFKAFKKNKLFVDFEFLSKTSSEPSVEIIIEHSKTKTIYQTYRLTSPVEIDVPFDYLDLVHDESFNIHVIVPKNSQVKFKKILLKFLSANFKTEKKYEDRISVVIVTYNKYAYVRELIHSFNHINYDRKLLDIVVVDNKSDDKTEAKLKAEFGNEIKVVQTGANLGGSGGFNIGMKYAVNELKNEYIWLLDNDVVIHPNALNELLTTLKNNSDAAAAGSMILQLDDQAIVSEVGASMDWKRGRVLIDGNNQRYDAIKSFEEKAIEYSAAASLLKRKSALEKIGYWGEYFIHFDDVDWCLRAIKNGMKIFCNPKSMVFHESMNKKQPTWIKYYNVRNLLYLYKNHKPSLLLYAILKFGLWSIYLWMHRLYKTSKMIQSAIIDFMCDVEGKMDYKHESYKPISKLNLDSSYDDALLVFYDFDNYAQFLTQTNFKTVFKNKVIIYNISEDQKETVMHGENKNIFSLPKYGRIFSLVKIFFTQISFCFNEKRKVILDGHFERAFMIPVFRNVLCVYPKYESYVDLEEENT